MKMKMDKERRYEQFFTMSVKVKLKDKQIKEAGGRLTSRYEDDTYYITLEAAL